jgi:hypothetical protein
MKELIEAYSPMETANFYMVSRPLVNSRVLNLIKELWTVPSIVFGETTIENGKLILRMRFHSSYKKDMSLILNRYLVIPYFIDDMLLVESEGFTVLLEKKNTRIPLSIIQYSIPISLHDTDPVAQVLEENNGVAQVVENPYNKDNFKLILFLEKPIQANDKFTAISEKDYIYETYSTNKLLNAIRDKANASGIFRNELLVKIKNGRIYSTSCTSSKRIMEYIKMAFSSSLDIYGQNFITIEHCSDFDQEMFSNL